MGIGLGRNWLKLASAAVLALGLSAAARAGEMEDCAEITRLTITDLMTRNYAALEALNADYVSPDARTSSGLWKLTLFFYAVNDSYPYNGSDEQSWKFAEGAAAGWTAAYPQSAAAHIGYAQMLYKHAWGFRGSGIAATVPPESWKPFAEYLRKAKAYLESQAAFAKDDPRYQDLMLMIANDLQEPEEDFAALARQAVEHHPGYFQIYFTIMNHDLPKWGGDTGKVEAFARDAVARTRASEGDGMYARIYWAASQFQFGDALFTASKANWADMKRGITDVLAKYDDAWNVNNFAKFACLAGDRDFARGLVQKIGGAPVAEAWDGGVSFEQCKAWSEAG